MVPLSMAALLSKHHSRSSRRHHEVTGNLSLTSAPNAPSGCIAEASTTAGGAAAGAGSLARLPNILASGPGLGPDAPSRCVAAAASMAAGAAASGASLARPPNSLARGPGCGLGVGLGGVDLEIGSGLGLRPELSG